MAKENCLYGKFNLNKWGLKTFCRYECTALSEFRGRLALDILKTAPTHAVAAEHAAAFIKGGAPPDVEEITLLFDYSRIYTGIWGLKRISLSFVLTLAAFWAIQWSLLWILAHVDAGILFCTRTATALPYLEQNFCRKKPHQLF